MFLWGIAGGFQPGITKTPRSNRPGGFLLLGLRGGVRGQCHENPVTLPAFKRRRFYRERSGIRLYRLANLRNPVNRMTPVVIRRSHLIRSRIGNRIEERFDCGTVARTTPALCDGGHFLAGYRDCRKCHWLTSFLVGPGNRSSVWSFGQCSTWHDGIVTPSYLRSKGPLEPRSLDRLGSPLDRTGTGLRPVRRVPRSSPVVPSEQGRC
jgi:hypothetical protein